MPTRTLNSDSSDLEFSEILAQIAKIMGTTPPRIKIPHNWILPLAYIAETRARLMGGKDPFITVDGLKMAKKKMFFSSEKAKQELGYVSRPASEALRDAIGWFRKTGQLNV